MARAAPEDPWCGLADPSELAADAPDLDLVDGTEPSVDELDRLALEAEDAARAVPGITNSEGAEAGCSRSAVSLVTSTGFARTYERTTVSVGVSVLAGHGTGMERDYESRTAVHADDLPAPAELGRRAGERAVRRLDPRKAGSARVPVVFDPRVANSLLGHLATAVNGSAIARGTSFLKGRLGEPVFAPSITIVDDPRRKRGLRSRAFDGEGIATRPLEIVSGGRLATWVLDLATARQLGLATTGHASRGTSGPPTPSPSNLHLEAGSLTPAELMADITSGFYVSELIGFGVNLITGDYSRGASGFWIENGTPAWPVSEVTIAGNLADMFRDLAAASDLEFRYGTDAPTVRIDGMTVAGR